MIKMRLKNYKMKLKQSALLNLKINNLEKLNADSLLLKQCKDLLETLNCELQQLDIALECLEDDEAYLVKEHYVMGRTWLSIEMTYNRIFRSKPKLEIEALRKKADRSLKTLKEFFEPLNFIDIENCINA